MFRDLTRKKQKLSLEECKEILKQEVRGVLAVNGDGGYPYALPINFYLVHRLPPFAFSIDNWGNKEHEPMVEWREINHRWGEN